MKTKAITISFVLVVVLVGLSKSFVDKLNCIPKIVFSKTLESAPWGDWEEAKIVKTTAVKEVANLKRRPGKHMVIWGNISLAQSLIKEDLIDEYRLVMCPVVRGSGRSLFLDEVESFGLKLWRQKRLIEVLCNLSTNPLQLRRPAKNAR